MATTSYLGLSLIFLFLLSSADANIKPTRRGVTLQLVHRFSPSLTFHKTETFEQFLERNDERYIKSFTTFQQESIDVQLITPTSRSPEHLFFVHLSIGEPPVTQYLAMDTGSYLTWVIGDSLKREFRYPPHRSSTYSNITCGSDACNKLNRKSYCNSIGNCMCGTRYGDNRHMLETYLAYDRFLFHNATVDKVVMGINYKGKGSLFDDENFYGVFGLSPPYPSFVHWLPNLGAKKFSYYINGKVTDSLHPYAGLTIGDQADIQGDNTTPLKIDGAHYHISLESISLGTKKLDIDPRIFAQKGNEGGTGVIVDSGSIKTWLPDAAYDKVYIDVLHEMVKRDFEEKPNTKGLCFYGYVEQVTRSDFPILSFNFADGASLQLDEDDLFIDSPSNYFCMSVMPSSTNGPTMKELTIIGLTAQQDYIMGYDLENQRLAMKLWNL